MTSGLGSSTLAVVRRVWADRLRVSPQALGRAGVVVVDRPDLTAAVVVRLGESVALAAPPAALSLLAHLEAPHLLDVDILLDVLAPLRPRPVGVAAAAGSRGRGLAARAASTAALHALDAGLVPQWRCRVDNVASDRVAGRLGFVRAGAQVAIDLDPTGRDDRPGGR